MNHSSFNLPEGFTAKITHYRYVHVFNEDFTPELMTGIEWRGNYQPASKGGKTIANIYDADGNRIATGVAHCNKRDNFNYRLGREIALNRAMFEAFQGDEVERRKAPISERAARRRDNVKETLITA